ncbi:MAG: sensor histidine kinase [Muribaculaceae bacterium]|nr:sensor histidine kinase [Muribaculaceae bacterium]
MERKQDTDYKKVERVIYAALWCVVALIPLVVQGYEYMNGTDAEFEFDKAVKTWIAILPFFLLFWVHDLMLMPMLMRRRSKWLYGVLTVTAIAGMIVIMDMPRRAHRHERDNELREVIVTDIDTGKEIRRFTRVGRPQPPFNMMLLMNVAFALFVVSVNIAVKLYFRALSNRRRIARLEAENTSTRLQFLKYQINPHFFMNTLNNIHALIDIDAERARDVVIELSKLMRYVLYEIDKDEVTLRQEVDFLNNYIELMRIRLTDNVKINVGLPDDAGDIKLPPLLFIPFVENIFKHGVSYREPSVIDISLRVDAKDGITFRSVNSNHAKSRGDSHHGIGLENLRRRLDLLYPGNYILEINNNGDTFETRLTIPAALQRGADTKKGV